MPDTIHFATVVLLVGGAGLVAVVSNRLTELVKVPLALLMLVGAAVAVNAVDSLQVPPERTVERAVTVCLVLILFDGGMHIGWARFRRSAAPIVTVGVLGTFLTAAGCAALLYFAFGLEWYLALLVGTAVAPTDPAVVFSVLGRREVVGRVGSILEGESGANDPVGIALMSGLLVAGGLSAAAALQVGGTFVLQMGVGALFGVAGGRALLWFMRTVPLPSEGLYPLRTLTSAALLYGAATLAQGSGFLAVFVAGIVLGDARAPFKREIERFHAALAGLAEIVAFIVLGLTVDLGVLARTDVWVPALVLFAVLTVVVRPVAVGVCLVRARLRPNELTFVMAAGLKGAVPILLGILLLAAGVPQAERLYGIVIVVVVLSVLVQGSLVPAGARLLRLRMRTVEPEPWALGVRLREEPEGAYRVRVHEGSAAEGRTVHGIVDAVDDVWVSMVVREQQLVQARGDTTLRADDEVVILADPDQYEQLAALFRAPG